MIYLPTTRQWRLPELPGLLVPAGVAGLALVVIALMRIGLAFIAAGLVLLVVLCVLAISHPLATSIFMVAYTSVNRFVVMLALHYTGSVGLTKALELWKEGVLAILILRVLYELLFTPYRSHTIKFMDLLVAFFIAVSAVYVIYPGPLNVDLFTRLQGFRTDTVFMFAYFIGRGLHVRRRDVRWLVLVMVAGSVLTGAVAVWQISDSAGANQAFNNLGYQDFSVLQTGTTGPGVVRARDLPGAALLPRASSLQLSDLALAFYQLLAVALAAAMYFLSRRRIERVVTGVFLAAMIATIVLTATRSAIGSALGGGLAAAAVSGQILKMAVFALLVGAVTVIALAYGPVSSGGLFALVNFQDRSSQKIHEREQ
ncbi:MAG TPA: hypothetical protein VGG90_10425, partial [Candidatus Dormibacteraeota bacterium]